MISSTTSDQSSNSTVIYLGYIEGKLVQFRLRFLSEENRWVREVLNVLSGGSAKI
jgi:hypothetical protein